MRTAIDIGGTFTDFVQYDPDTGTLDSFKILSSPKNPSLSFFEGLSRESIQTNQAIYHGSTVATNALLENKGAKTALITTKGFGDVIEIGRQNRPDLYDLNPKPIPSLIPRVLRFEITERVNHLGEVITPIDISSIRSIIDTLKALDVKSVAVVFLFSFLFPDHEKLVKTTLEKDGFSVSISSDILPEFREYERTSTTVINAYVSPIMQSYLSELEDGLKKTPLHIMQSNGGTISPTFAIKNAARCILSGPAGGVVGAQEIAKQAGFPKIITFDMGGTSTDVALVNKKINISHQSKIGGHPIHIPMIDIHTVGAGGGSIAKIDAGMALTVGPESAGADPGPACYGKGNLPTVTDANLVLGRILSDSFFGGKLPLDIGKSIRAIETLSKPLGLSVKEVALGMIKIANVKMERAIRLISLERGFDPRDFTLVSFGGAGGLHAIEIAKNMGIANVIIPPHAATLSAMGMLMADIIKNFSKTVMIKASTAFSKLIIERDILQQQAINEFAEEGIDIDQIEMQSHLDCRYSGQSFELQVPFTQDFATHFHDSHEKEFGFHTLGNQIDVVNIRLTAVHKILKPSLPKLLPSTTNIPQSGILESKVVIFEEGEKSTQFYLGEELKAGNQINGPAIVMKKDTTILIPAQYTGTIDSFGNIIILLLDKS